MNYYRVFLAILHFCHGCCFLFSRYSRGGNMGGAGAAGGCLAGVLAGAGPGMAGGPYARLAEAGPPLPGPYGTAWSPGLARRGARARQVGKEPNDAAPGTHLLTVSGLAAGPGPTGPSARTTTPARPRQPGR